MSVIDELKKSDVLRRSAMNNDYESFAKYAIMIQLDDALTESLDQNYAFLSLLLNDENYKKQIVSIYTDEIYKQLREDSQ